MDLSFPGIYLTRRSLNFQDNVQELLIAGDMIELQEVVQLCTDYLLDQVCLELIY